MGLARLRRGVNIGIQCQANVFYNVHGAVIIVVISMVFQLLALRIAVKRGDCLCKTTAFNPACCSYDLEKSAWQRPISSAEAKQAP